VPHRVNKRVGIRLLYLKRGIETQFSHRTVFICLSQCEERKNLEQIEATLLVRKTKNERILD